MADTVTVRDREIEVKALNETQKMLMVREASILRSARQDFHRKMQALSNVFTIVESVVVDADDRAFLQELASTGELEFKEMLDIATALEQPDEEAPVKAVATVRRAARKR